MSNDTVIGWWYRVFGTAAAAPEPAGLLEYLQSAGLPIAGHFRGDDQGWFAAELVPEGAPPVTLERYLATEDGVRADLNGWAAWLETVEHSPLMEHMVGTAQLFTLRRPIDYPDDALVERLCVAVCQFLAGATAGVYQIDDRGFFAADGALLLEEK
jgi:hypothetical protein